MDGKMLGAMLPGDSTVKFKEFDIPKPGHGQVLVKTMASTICGSDIRAIYREHTGKGAEGYIDGMIAGHEPCGQIVEEGPGLVRFKKGDRVIVYHIHGCGVCHDCRMGYQISCSSPHRAAYGWQRDGGMAEYMLCDERDLVLLPDELTYCDGAQVACGFGTVYEAIEKVGVSGNDAVLVVGLGPVGLATLMLCRALGANKLIGVEMSDERIELAKKLNLVDEVFKPGPDTLEKIKASRRPAVGQDRLCGRGRHGVLQSVAGHHPRSEDHLRQLGDEPCADGGSGGAAGALGHSPGGPDHPPVQAGGRGQGLRPDGLRPVRQGRHRIRRHRERINQAFARRPALSRAARWSAQAACASSRHWKDKAVKDA